MAIDRIGKGGGIPPTPESPGKVQEKGTVSRPFEVERAGTKEAKEAGAAQGTSAAAATGAASPLERLRAGEIDVHGYVDLKVDEATNGLHGLSPAELDEIKKVLRDQIATDPGLTDLVREATGRMPQPPED